MRYRCTFMLAALLAASLARAQPSIGDLVIYSDGEAERLVAVDRESQTWENTRLQRLRRALDPLLPLLERRELLGERGHREHLVQGDPSALQRATVGTRIEFTTLRTRQPSGETARRNWRCEVLDDGVAQVLGRDRQLRRYRCDRYTVHRKLWTKQIKETRTLGYSPELGLVVEYRRERPGKAASTRDLVDLIPRDRVGREDLDGRLQSLRKAAATR